MPATFFQSLSLINKAKSLTDNKEISGALQCYNDALNIEPFNIDALMYRASLHIENHDFDKAKDDAIKIGKVQKDNIQVRLIQ